MSRFSDDGLRDVAIRENRLLSCTLELTPKCNFRCKMCGYSMTDAQCESIHYHALSLFEWMRILAELKKIGVLLVTLTGGEPLLFPGFEKIYTFLKENGFQVAIKTNGYLVDSYRWLFEKYPPCKVYISVYGWTDETYRDVTGIADAAQKVKDAIGFFSGISVPVQTAFVALKNNYWDKAGYDEYFLNPPKGVAKGILTDIYPHVVDESFSSAVQYRLTPVMRVAWENTVPFCDEAFLEKVQSLVKRRQEICLDDVWGVAEASKTVKRCLSAQSSCFIGSDGKMRYCATSRYIATEPLLHGVEPAWKQLIDQQDLHFVIPSKCAGCKLRNQCLFNCPSRCYVGGHSLVKPPDYLCEYTILKCIDKRVL